MMFGDSNDQKLREMALFAGSGGGLLGARLLGWKTVCAVEIDAYCREILLRRQEEGYLEPFPIWDDIRTFDGEPWRCRVDVVTAGFPCQPFSNAGSRKGKNDSRNLWSDTIKVICEVGPRFCFLENVPALRCAHGKGVQKEASYFGQILRDLAESGYDCRWDCIPASAVGANHQRDRLWIVCYPHKHGKSDVPINAEMAGMSNVADSKKQSERAGLCESGSPKIRGRRLGNYGCSGRGEDSAEMANSKGTGSRAKRTEAVKEKLAGFTGRGWWATEPALGRVAHGVARRVDRLRAIGNGQVPAVVRAAWDWLRF